MDSLKIEHFVNLFLEEKSIKEKILKKIMIKLENKILN